MLPDRDPTVPVTLTPDAERITARVEGWMRECRDRAERGQVKYPSWHTATTPRNAGREGVEEALDLLWYLSAAQDQIAHLTVRIAELGRERDSALDELLWLVDEAVNAECTCGGMGPTDPACCPACGVWHRLLGRDRPVTATQEEARHD